MNDKLYEQLERWNGKYSDDLIAVYDEHKKDKTFLKDLLEINASPRHF